MSTKPSSVRGPRESLPMPDLLPVQLHIRLAARLDLLLDPGNHGLHVDDPLLGDMCRELHHLLGDGLAYIDEALNTGSLLPVHPEALLPLGSVGVQTAPDGEMTVSGFVLDWFISCTPDEYGASP